MARAWACAYCGAPVKKVAAVGGWVHTQPLAALRVTRWEASDIRNDPPRAGQELNRQTHLHPAEPER